MFVLGATDPIRSNEYCISDLSLSIRVVRLIEPPNYGEVTPFYGYRTNTNTGLFYLLAFRIYIY